METLPLSKNWKYWIFNFFGWIAFYWFTLSFLKLKLAILGDVVTSESVRIRNTYFLWEGFACGLLCCILSFAILFYLEKAWNWDSIEKPIIIKLALVFILVQIVYSISIWPLLEWVTYAVKGPDADYRVASFSKKLRNVPYFASAYLIWFLLVFVHYGYHYLKNTKMRRLELEANLNKSRLNTLKGQINPHFMFNSLNNIRGLMLEDVNKSRSMLTKLSEILRFSLNTGDVNLVPLEKEVEVVESFIALSKIQFEERLDFVMELNDVDLQMMIPPMVIQLLVENAVKHGISNLKKGGSVKLTLENKNDFLLILVSNSGKLRIGSDSTQVGLENIKKRLQLIYGEKAFFSLVEDQNEVLATIKIPRS